MAIGTFLHMYMYAYVGCMWLDLPFDWNIRARAGSRTMPPLHTPHPNIVNVHVHVSLGLAIEDRPTKLSCTSQLLQTTFGLYQENMSAAYTTPFINFPINEVL